VVLSTIKVEYIVDTHERKEAIWLQRLCSGIGLVQQAIRIDCDSHVMKSSWQRTRLIIQRQIILMFNITF
jgi:hypothetical protein